MKSKQLTLNQGVDSWRAFSLAFEESQKTQHVNPEKLEEPCTNLHSTQFQRERKYRGHCLAVLLYSTDVSHLPIL